MGSGAGYHENEKNSLHQQELLSHKRIFFSCFYFFLSASLLFRLEPDKFFLVYDVFGLLSIKCPQNFEIEKKFILCLSKGHIVAFVKA